MPATAAPPASFDRPAVPGGWIALAPLDSRETFAHQHVLVPARMIVNGRDDLERVFPVEPRCLEGERHQVDLGAATPSRFLLGRLQQLRADAAVPQRFLHPELPQLTGPAPGVPAHARDDAIALAHEEREQLAAPDA